MAFVSSVATPFRSAQLRTARRCALSATPVAVAPRRAAHVAAAPVRAAPRMATQDYPDSKVLGVGAEIPSSLFLIASAIALPLGCFCVYKSNLLSPLTPDSINPQFVVGSLLAPISWGLHVAGFIQMKNGK